jgi:hypothetical protein
MINTKLQNIIDTKSAIGNAITNKGGTITTNTPFFNYAAEIDSISTGGGAYSTFVAQDQNNAKYEAYNGFHAIDNPTPNLSNNFTFNRWLLNNSATGDVVLPNVITSQVTTVPFSDNSAGINEIYMPFVNNTADYGASILTGTTNDGFLYVGGQSVDVKKYHESNLVFNSSVNYGGAGEITTLTTNNGFLYVGGGNFDVKKYHESNLVFNSSVNYGFFTIRTITINNGFIYVGGGNPAKKYHESNLTFVGQTDNFGGSIRTLITNNGFLYAGGFTNQSLQKFNESTLAFVGNTVNSGGIIYELAANNGFIYVGQGETVKKYYESNLALVGNTASYGGTIFSLTTNNGFIYVGGSALTNTNRGVSKFYESNLALVSNTVNYGGAIFSVTTNNGFIYAGGTTNQTVQKFVEQSNNLVETPVFQITTIKE